MPVLLAFGNLATRFATPAQILYIHDPEAFDAETLAYFGEIGLGQVAPARPAPGPAMPEIRSPLHASGGTKPSWLLRLFLRSWLACAIRAIANANRNVARSVRTWPVLKALWLIVRTVAWVAILLTFAALALGLTVFIAALIWVLLVKVVLPLLVVVGFLFFLFRL